MFSTLSHFLGKTTRFTADILEDTINDICDIPSKFVEGYNDTETTNKPKQLDKESITPRQDNIFSSTN